MKQLAVTLISTSAKGHDNAVTASHSKSSPEARETDGRMFMHSRVRLHVGDWCVSLPTSGHVTAGLVVRSSSILRLLEDLTHGRVSLN